MEYCLEEMESIKKLEGLKVVDCSFLPRYVRGYWLDRKYPEQVHTFELEERLYDFLTASFDDQWLFSSEFFNEFGRLTSVLSRSVKKVKKNLHKKNISKLRRDEIGDFLRSIELLVKKRKKFSHNLSRSHSAESYLEQKGFSDSMYLDTILEIGRWDGIKRCFAEKYGKSAPLSQHKYNDESLFSKSLELSRTEPVNILTNDSDFIRIHHAFYDNLDRFSRKYGFEVPAYAISLIISFNKPLQIIEPLERPKPLQGLSEIFI